MRHKRTYTQPTDESIHVPFYTPEEVQEHLDRVKLVLRSPEPKTFAEYRQWLQDWRRAWHREVKVIREMTTAFNRYKLAGGLGRYADNSPYKMTPRIEEAFKAACANVKAHGGLGTGYAVRCDLLKLRIDRKPLGARLWHTSCQ